MSDLFHESVPDEWIDRIFAVMALGFVRVTVIDAGGVVRFQSPSAERILGDLMLAVQGFGLRSIPDTLSAAFQALVGREPSRAELREMIDVGIFSKAIAAAVQSG